MANYTFPIKNKFRITDGFKKHIARGSKLPGTDFAVKTGTPVYSVRGGKVKISAVTNGASGTFVKISHSRGTVYSYYLHLSKLNCKPGQKVGQGELIGWSGNTGNSTGPHLHFSLRVLGKLVDPMKYLA